MLKLETMSALEKGSLPFEVKTVTLLETQPQSIVSVAPFKGQGIGVNQALKKVAKLSLPKVGDAITNDKARALWIGHGVWLVIDVAANTLADALVGKAAVTDQSDAWCVLTLKGEIDPVLARLSSFDFSQLEQNQVTHTEFAKVSAILTRNDDGIEIMLQRSAAQWVVGQIRQAMLNVSEINEIKK